MFITQNYLTTQMDTTVSQNDELDSDSITHIVVVIVVNKVQNIKFIQFMC